jgi:hypothetical protein
MFYLSQAWFLSMMLTSTSYDYSSVGTGYHPPTDRWRPETTINGNIEGNYYRTLDDCMIAASEKERWLRGIYGGSSPMVAMKCDHNNPNVNSPNRPASIQAIEYVKKVVMK